MKERSIARSSQSPAGGCRSGQIGVLAPFTIGLHECRHTFASLMIAAGVNAKALSSFMGHSSVTITLDRYGHLFPGSEAEAAGLLDEYLARAGGGPCVSAVTGGRVRRDAGRWRALKDRRAAISRSSSVAGVTARPTSGRRDL